MTTRVFAFVCLVSVMGCAATSTSTSSDNGTVASNTRMNEAKKGSSSITNIDTKKYRPLFPVTPSGTIAIAPAVPIHHIRNQVDLLMDSVAQVNKNIRYAAGYRILVYTGIERKAAMDLRNNIIQRLPEQKDYLTYKQPTYQLKIGDFFTRVEAQAALSKIQDLLPNALLVQETINIPK